MTELIDRLRSNEDSDAKLLWLLNLEAADEIEKLKAERAIAEFSEAAAVQEVERLRECENILAGLKWKSIDKDNMEFSTTITTWYRDKIAAAIRKGTND